MLSSRELLTRSAAAGGAILVDVEGGILELHQLAEGATAPALVVGPVTEAVKTLQDGSVLHGVDRDTLWAVEALLLDERVLRQIGEFVGTAENLIELVAAAGNRWRLA